MAVVEVEKVVLAVHKTVKDSFLKELQRRGVIHLAETKVEFKTTPAIERMNSAVNQLARYNKKKSIIETFVKLRTPVSIEDFENYPARNDYMAVVGNLERINKTRDELSADLNAAEKILVLLEPWQPLDCALHELTGFDSVVAIPAAVPSPEKMSAVAADPAAGALSWEEINVIGNRHYLIFYVHKKDADLVRNRLAEHGCEMVHFPRHLSGTPAQISRDLSARIQSIKTEITAADRREEELFTELRNLSIAADHEYNAGVLSTTAAGLPSTASTVNITGWIKKSDIRLLDDIVRTAVYCSYERVEPEPGEDPPVVLKNRRWSAPYEMLIRLYGMPGKKEYDPTVFLAIFFPLFFAVCMTDAIYGLALALFSFFYLMKKIKGDRSLLWILGVGGLISIPAGCLVGSWAGNLPDLIGIPFLIRAKNSIMLFDPIADPMPFFYFALAVGLVHVLIGVLIEVYDDLRHREYGRAIFQNLTWFTLITGLLLYFTIAKNPAVELIVLVSIVGIILFSNPTGNPGLIDQLLWSVIVFLGWVYLTRLVAVGIFQRDYSIQIPGLAYAGVLPLLLIALLRFRQTRIILTRIAWGLYNLYGITSFLSFVLSYIRLMALGMVTSGIALTINMIAWMVIKIPVAGIVLALVILVAGHAFNLAISTLGGFIHTLRLQYIEFFGRFYSGGGKPFKPFRLETKYVEIL